MIVTNENILEVKNYLATHVLKSADSETYGIKYTDSLFSFIIAAGDRAFYFNFKNYPDEGITGLDPRNKELMSHVQEIFSRGYDTWFLHNAKFDLHKLRRLGVEVRGIIWCTKIHARILRNNLLDYSLFTLTKNQVHKKSDAADRYVSEHGLKSKRAIEGKDKVESLEHYDQIPFSIISSYGLDDGLCTLELGLNQMKQYGEQPSLHAVRDNELLLVRAIFEMESEGIGINRQYIKEAWEYEEGLIRETKAEFERLTGCDYDSTKKLKLVELLKASGESIPMTDAGNPRLNADALKLMTSPVAALIQKIRYHEKRISAFYSTFLEHADYNDVIHANIDIAGTETGRFSMSNPNLQQLSRDKKVPDKYSIRGCFRPRHGRCFVQWDYAQQEYRLMADYANERKLIEKIAAGYDVHEATAQLVGITRDEAKTVNFAILYGAGAAKLAIMLKISLSEAKRLIDKYFAALPMVESFIERVKATGKSRMYIFNWLGRICRIANREWAYILPNHLIQGSGADVMKVAIVKVYKLLSERQAKSKMVLTVHDSLVLEMVEEEYYLIPEITSILETVYKSRNGVVLKTDLEHSFVSLRKADMKKGAPDVRAA